MYGSFYKRMNRKGNTVGEVMKKQSDQIMEKTFLNDLHTKKVRVHNSYKAIDVWTYAKYQSVSVFSVLKDQIDYRIQFKPGEQYPIGCYIDIPNNDDEYETWLLVGRDDHPQFPRYSVLKCNWTFKWILNQTIYSSLGVLRSRNSYNSGVWNDGFFTVVENQDSFWVPTNPDTQTINYNMRFLLSENKVNPISYIVSKVEDTFPVGITKITLKQDLYNPNTDNTELMIADYYSNSIEPKPQKKRPTKNNAVITYNGNAPKIVIGGSFKVLTGKFYNDSGQQLSSVQCNWTADLDNEEAQNYELIDDGNTLKIKAKENYNLVGQIIKVGLSAADNSCSTSIDLEVCAR